MLAPLLLTATVLGVLYNARGSESDLRPGWRYKVGFPREALFANKTDAEIRAEVAQRSVRNARVHRITPDTVWLSIEHQNDVPGQRTEAELIDYWQSIGAQGPYVLLFGAF